MVTFKSAAIAASGEARRAPPPPLGYEASGDITVRGFDALGDIDTAQFDRTFLPLIKFLGSPATAADGAAVLTYHLSGALGQPLKLNGSDIGGWFGGTATHPPAPLARALRLEQPPLTGDDVRAVQQALKPRPGPQFADGVYDSATAVAVAAFQKQAGLNADGIVDAATRAKLGIVPPPAPAPKN
ncbi:MAG: peptidoglycan-binding protein [Alphaproteobacteria bacterium]|nr:peptidoglycan-binding protein [Alphaproteobacteria bacterium]